MSVDIFAATSSTVRNAFSCIFYEKLKRLEKFSDENEEMLYTIQLVAETLNGMKEEGERAQPAQQVEGGSPAQ